MNYRSTRDNKISVTSARAIAQGLSEEGGLFVPESIPQLTKEDITEILFTDLFGSINLFLAELDHGKDDSEIRDEAADLLTDCFEEFDFYGDFE